MKFKVAKWNPITNNITKGRGGAKIDRVTVHHTAIDPDITSLQSAFNNANRGASAHLYVHKKGIEQLVDTDDTAWANSSVFSNSRAITIEVAGTWDNSYYNQPTMDNLTALFAEIRKNFPGLALTYHRIERQKHGDGKYTYCPGNLLDANYAKNCWVNSEGFLPKFYPFADKAFVEIVDKGKVNTLGVYYESQNGSYGHIELFPTFGAYEKKVSELGLKLGEYWVYKFENKPMTYSIVKKTSEESTKVGQLVFTPGGLKYDIPYAHQELYF